MDQDQNSLTVDLSQPKSQKDDTAAGGSVIPEIPPHREVLEGAENKSKNGKPRSRNRHKRYDNLHEFELECTKSKPEMVAKYDFFENLLQLYTQRKEISFRGSPGSCATSTCCHENKTKANCSNAIQKKLYHEVIAK